MNILCVGNSFAVDVATYVHQIAEAAGRDIKIVVLYIPGCPVNKHWQRYQDQYPEYELYVNGDRNPVMTCTFDQGFNYLKHWDYITFQQRSGDSGDASTFFPELTLLMNELRKKTDAKFLLHETWSYAKTFQHEKYGSNPMDQAAMDKDIRNAYLEVSKKTDVKYIITSGLGIELARQVFGDELTRDGYHLNERGRTLAGMIWAYFLLGKNIDFSSFRPKGYTYDDVTGPVEEEELLVLNNLAKKALDINRGHNIYED